MTFAIQPDPHDDGTLLLTGDLDAATAVLVHDAVRAALADGRRDLTLDTAHLAFCDSRGIRALYEAHEAVAAGGGTMRLARVHGHLRRLLDITGLDQVLTVTADQPGEQSR